MVVMDCAVSQSVTEPPEREGEAAVRVNILAGSHITIDYRVPPA